MKYNVALFSDLHIGVHQNSEKWHKVALDWCDWFCGEITRNRVTHVFFLGDLFHYRNEVSLKTMNVGWEIVNKIASCVQQLVMIPGNHDCYYRDNTEVHSVVMFGTHPHIVVYDKFTTIKLGSKTLGFAPWGTTIDQITKCDVLFGHFDVCGFKMNNNTVSEHGFDPSELADKAPFIYSGHYHTRSKKKVKKSVIEYIGNPFEMDFNDINDEKGIQIFSLNGTWEFNEIILNDVSPKHKIININDANAPIENAIVKVVVNEVMTPQELDAKKIELKKHSPFEMTTSFNITPTNTVNEVSETFTSLSIEDAFEEFVTAMKLPEADYTSLMELLTKTYKASI